jgi:hypothetical protein
MDALVIKDPILLFSLVTHSIGICRINISGENPNRLSGLPWNDSKERRTATGESYRMPHRW